MQVLHISADFPDPLAPLKTNAIRGLLDLIEEVDQFAYSLNRVGPAVGIYGLTFDKTHRAVAYGAVPDELLSQTFLSRLARWIMPNVEARELTPDSVHAHKLSIEAIVGDKIARWLGVPLIVCCQRNSDLKVLKAKPDLHCIWREIWQGADWVLPFAPWTAYALKDLLGPRTGPVSFLPSPTAADAILKPQFVEHVIRLVINLDQAANKNVRPVIHGAGNGISGYFPRSDFARPVRPNGAAVLAKQLIDMTNEKPEIKAELTKAQETGALDFMRRTAIAKALYAVTGLEPPAANISAKPNTPTAKFSKVR